MKKSVIVAALGFCMLLVSCGKSDNAKTLVYGMYKEPMNLDPALVTDVPSMGVSANICEGLIGYQGENGTKIVPKLATKWDISSDAKTYTFHLRDGVKFHDGTAMDADAVLFSLQRQQDKNNPYYKDSFSFWIGSGVQENIVSIDKTDEKTVVIKLLEPDGTFLSKMALSMAFVISPTAYKKLGDEFDKNPVCTGPFIFKTWEKAQSILMVKNDQYWDKEEIPKIDKVIYKFVTDASARLLGLKKGEIDVAEEISPQDVKTLETDSNLEFVKKPVLYQTYLWFNVDHKPFDDVRVRKAIAHLVDKQKLVNNALLGFGKVAVNPIPTTMWGYNKDIVDYDYNVDKAKQLLAEAGYPNGFEMDLSYNKENFDRKATAEILQAFLAEAGIKVTIKNSEWGTFLNEGKYRKYTGGSLSGWGADYIDPDDYLRLNFSKKAAIMPGLNIGGWHNDEFDKYNDHALRITDQDVRTTLYKKSQEIFHEEVPAIVLFDKVAIFGARKNVKNFIYLPLMYPVFNKVEKN